MNKKGKKEKILKDREGGEVTGIRGDCPGPHGAVHNVEKFILFNLLKSELQYCRPFRNGSATK